MAIPLRQISDELASFDFAKSVPIAFSDDTFKHVTDLEAVSALLIRIAELLKIPEACTKDEDELTSTMIIQREQFLRHSPALLSRALSLLRLLPSPQSKPSLEDTLFRTNLILIFGRLTDGVHGEGFISRSSPSTANKICDSLLAPASASRYTLIHHILSKTFPPLYKPHPKLNPSTGRALARPKGGEKGILDWYEESETKEGWRSEAGMGNVIKVIINRLETQEIENLWPLLLPPLLAYLDDYDVGNKWIGTTILSALLRKVDSNLLKRTGVGLIFQHSLSLCFSSLASPYTPDLLRTTHAVALQLLSITNPPLPSTPTSQQARFDALSTILESGILHTWEFKSNHTEIELAVLDSLPALLEQFGVGCIRYLQILIPRLCELLTAGSGIGGIGVPDEVKRKAGENLILVIELGRLRMERWSGVILGSVAKCWVDCKERDGAGDATGEKVKLEDTLRDVMGILAAAVPGIQEKLPKLKELDPLFASLLPIEPAIAV